MTSHLPLLAAVLLAAATPALRAQTVDRNNGESGAAVLQLTTVPRNAALGGAGAAADGATSLFTNPAGLTSVHRFGLGIAGQTLFDGAKAGSVALGVGISGLTFGLGAQYLDMGSVDEVVCDGCGGRGTSTGQSFSATEDAITAAAAMSVLGRASVGVSATYYSTSLADESGSATSFSAGIRAEAHPMLTLGASIQYLGGDATVAGFAAPLPRTARVGAELHPLAGRPGNVHLSILADYLAVRGAPGRVVGGVEAGILPASSLGVLARVGFGSSSSDFAGQAVSFGGGLRYRRIAFDYAYQGSDVFGAMHRLGVTVDR